MYVLTTEVHSTASFHPPHFDSRCLQILSRWLERSLRQQKKKKQDIYKKKNNHMQCAVAWILQLKHSAVHPGGKKCEKK